MTSLCSCYNKLTTGNGLGMVFFLSHHATLELFYVLAFPKVIQQFEEFMGYCDV